MASAATRTNSTRMSTQSWMTLRDPESTFMQIFLDERQEDSRRMEAARSLSDIAKQYLRYSNEHLLEIERLNVNGHNIPKKLQVRAQWFQAWAEKILDELFGFFRQHMLEGTLFESDDIAQSLSLLVEDWHEQNEFDSFLSYEDSLLVKIITATWALDGGDFLTKTEDRLPVEQAILTLSQLATNPENHQMLIAGGTIPLLFDVLEHSNVVNQNNAVLGLRKLSETSEGLAAISNENGVTTLLAVVNHGSTVGHAHARAILDALGVEVETDSESEGSAILDAVGVEPDPVARIATAWAPSSNASRYRCSSGRSGRADWEP